MASSGAASRLAAARGVSLASARWVLVPLLAPVIVTVFLLHFYRVVEPPFTPYMLQRRVAGSSIERRVIPLAAVSPHLVRAVLAGEDARYCAHGGVDWRAVYDAAVAVSAGRVRGGSTVTQQTAKNALLWHGSNTILRAARKPPEAALALVMDGYWGKRRVLELYLGVVELGDGLYGVEAAARRYFRTTASDLTAAQAAQLVATLPAPRVANPATPSPGWWRRAARIQRGMGQVDTSCLR